MLTEVAAVCTLAFRAFKTAHKRLLSNKYDLVVFWVESEDAILFSAQEMARKVLACRDAQALNSLEHLHIP
jgi:hypothetical protein